MFGGDEVEVVAYILILLYWFGCAHNIEYIPPNKEGDLLLSSSKPLPSYISVISEYQLPFAAAQVLSPYV